MYKIRNFDFITIVISIINTIIITVLFNKNFLINLGKYLS